MRFLVIVEQSGPNWGAHIPDLPGCVAVAKTKSKVIALIREAVDLHLDGLKRSGDVIPNPSCESLFVETDAA